MQQPRPSIVADVGGTNTRLALAEGGRLRPEPPVRIANAAHPDLAALIADWLEGIGRPPVAGLCAAVAGPVEGATARLTNIGWEIAAPALSARLGGVPVRLLNDLQAQGHALGRLEPSALLPLHGPAAPPEGAARLVIGVGTGFNAAAVHQTGAGRLVTASECGHAALPTPTEADRRLADHLARVEGFAEVEGALSGRGLANIDAWLAAERGGPPGRRSTAIMAALEAGEPRSEAAVATAVRLLGAVAGDLALVHLPFGGVYLVGGMARALAAQAGRFGLAEAFAAKGRFAPMMARFPLTLISDDYAALTGCAAFLAEDGARDAG